MSVEATVPELLSKALRDETRTAHEQAETAPYMQQLLSGNLPLSAYTALVAQNHAIYQALESIAEHWRNHPIAGPFVLAELTRLPSLEADLTELLGADWPEHAAALRVPATERYLAHLRHTAEQRPESFIAQHYVRYLGDLSGGQIVKASIDRIYGEEGRRATSFYTFAEIPKIKPFRDRYRLLLDAAVVDSEQRAEIVAEAVISFQLNRAVFLDLGTTVNAVMPSMTQGKH